MTTTRPPRTVPGKIDWFLSNTPDLDADGTWDRGACANHTWKALGGDYGNPPRWGKSTANAVIDAIIKSGRYWTPQTWKGDPPAGAIMGWRYGKHGHLAIKAIQPGKIVTTDPSNGRPTGIEPLDYPKRFGFSTSNGPYTVWTDTYNGVLVPVGGSVSVSATDDYISEKETAVRKFRTNTDVLIDCKGKTRWVAEVPTGRHTLAMYVNIDLPPGGSEERKAICRGGVRTWYQQQDLTDKTNQRDETGYNGPIPPALFGAQHHLVAHSWPHVVDKDYWEFCFRVYAFDAAGKPVDIELELETREIKIVGDKT